MNKNLEIKLKTKNNLTDLKKSNLAQKKGYGDFLGRIYYIYMYCVFSFLFVLL